MVCLPVLLDLPLLAQYGTPDWLDVDQYAARRRDPRWGLTLGRSTWRGIVARSTSVRLSQMYWLDVDGGRAVGGRVRS